MPSNLIKSARCLMVRRLNKQSNNSHNVTTFSKYLLIVLNRPKINFTILTAEFNLVNATSEVCEALNETVSDLPTQNPSKKSLTGKKTMGSQARLGGTYD